MSIKNKSTELSKALISSFFNRDKVNIIKEELDDEHYYLEYEPKELDPHLPREFQITKIGFGKAEAIQMKGH